MSGDKHDLSSHVARSAFRRARVSHGLTAGIPKDLPRERIHCRGCKKYITYRQVYTVWEFAPGRAWRMRACRYCHTMVEEKEFDLSATVRPVQETDDDSAGDSTDEGER